MPWPATALLGPFSRNLLLDIPNPGQAFCFCRATHHSLLLPASRPLGRCSQRHQTHQLPGLRHCHACTQQGTTPAGQERLWEVQWVQVVRITGRDLLQLRWLWLLLLRNQPRSPTRLLPLKELPVQLTPLHAPTATHTPDIAVQRNQTLPPWAQGGSCSVDKNTAICSVYSGGNLSRGTTEIPQSLRWLNPSSRNFYENINILFRGT